MAVDARRIQSDVEAIARCTATPGAGATRPTMSAEWAAARDYVIAEAESAGCAVRIDAAGNVHARPTSLGWDAPAWLVGSHVDSVPHGGDFDGVIGVVLALELLRSAAEDGRSDLPVELIVFAEEEGPTFGLGMLGSRAWVGELNADGLAALRNAAGQNYLEAGASYGVVPERVGREALLAERYLGLIELHIEQGPGLWRRADRLGVVRAIAGRRQYRVAVTGEANHAGATAMVDRRDALTAAAEMALTLERLAPQLGDEAVLTVGRLEVEPNAVNVIASRVVFTIDFRAPDDATLADGDTRLASALGEIAERRGVGLVLEKTEEIPARPMAPWLVSGLHTEAEATAPELTVPVMVSGALHDAAVVAPYVPCVMLFVPSRDGISHNPEEFSRIDDVALAASVVERWVRKPTVSMLNEMDVEGFVAVCGEAFEHSPWIAARAWADRPFAGFEGLMDAMWRVVQSATRDERLGLIRAHPDLVGKLAKAGALTADSAAEQRGAGLEDVSAEEAALFESRNRAYREKFDFPFVVCARENRKEAILQAMPLRLLNEPNVEIDAALVEIMKIARHRLTARLACTETL